jgi:hypothetical protein
VTLDTLQPEGEKRVGITQSYDLATYDGLVLFVMDRLLQTLR